jgi:hypothetical protein
MDDTLYKKMKRFLANFNYFFSHMNEKNKNYLYLFRENIYFYFRTRATMIVAPK